MLLPTGMSAQDDAKETHPADTVASEVMEDKNPGFLGKIWQFFKFKENRDQSEQQRIQKVLNEMTGKNPELKIALDSVDQIKELLEKQNKEIIALQKNKGTDQEKSDTLEKIKITPSKLELGPQQQEKPKGFFKKMMQVFKFRENRDVREEKRIHEYIGNLIRKDTMKIDTTTVSTITGQFYRVDRELDSIDMLLDRFRIIARVADVELYDDDYDRFMLTKFDSITQNQEIDNLEHQTNLLIDALYTKLQEVTHSCTSEYLNEPDVPSFRGPKKDSVHVYKRCLKPLINVMGWHNTREKDNSENYNYNLLTSLNYDGYELYPDGTTKKVTDLNTEALPMAIKRAHKYGSDVYLTIHNNSRKEIHDFLSNEVAQSVLLAELKPLLHKNIINAINIYFADIYEVDKERFVLFIETIYQQLTDSKEITGSDFSPKLAITIPGIVNNRSRESIKAYDFAALNVFVSNYLVLTDKLINPSEVSVQSFSPLNSSQDSKSGTLTSTIDFYATNKEIPLSKLFITLGYSGIEWEVNARGEPKYDAVGKQIKYGDILDKYRNSNEVWMRKKNWFDPDQVTAVLGVVEYDKLEKNNAKYKQIWYDDARSLYLKYTWAKEKKLGGVALTEIAFDDGGSRFGDEYLRLWKTLGAALVKIDSVSHSVKTLPDLTYNDYIKRFYNDLKWAMLNEPAKNEEWEYKDFLDREVKEVEEKTGVYTFKNGFIGFNKSYFLGDKVKDYRKVGYEDPELDTRDQSLYAFLRWRIYARIFLIAFFFFSAIAGVFYYKKVWYLRYPPKKKLTGRVLNIFRIIFFLSAIASLLGYLYFEPEVDIGGSANQWIALDTLSILLVIGCVIGIWITPFLKRTTLVPKDMP
ncbi:MAG TPA: glycosyl hydrolase family 18 protein [Eudoraea sp.]|nr:glycosyl hydrolase family 18 protein [Eudoraea sp.]